MLMSKKINLNFFRISRIGLFSCIGFILLSFLARFVLPRGDEPDWGYRSKILADGEGSLFSPYTYFQTLVDRIDINSFLCEGSSNLMLFWMHIDSICSDSVSQVFFRMSLTILAVAPVFLLIIFRRISSDINSDVGFLVSSAKSRMEARLNAISLSLVFPGMIYYLGLFAEEQFFLSLALMSFAFRESRVLFSIILLVLFNIDSGNSIVFIGFFIFQYLFLCLYKRLGAFVFWILLLVVLLFAFVFGFSLVDYIGLGAILEYIIPGSGGKILSIANVLMEEGLVDKYPLYLRPVITFMSFVFFTPSGIKSIFSFLFVAALLIVGLTIYVRKYKYLHPIARLDGIRFFILPIFYVILIVIIIPNYANAKYYMFILPMIIYSLLSVFRVHSLLFVFFGLSFFTFGSVSLYYF
jgi:hypothetical protein